MPWWQLLQKYTRIDGDIKTQSVVMTIVYNDSTQGGHTKYKTYYIPRPVDNNVIAYSIQILDDKNEILEKSERPLEKVTDAFGGADATDKMDKIKMQNQYFKGIRFVELYCIELFHSRA